MDLVAAQGMRVSRTQINDLLPTPNTMEHREIKTPEQIAELKAKSPGGYRNLRETVVNELPMFPTPIVRDYKDGQAEVLRNGKVQTDTVGRAIMNSGEVKLLPTLRASDGYERRNQKTMDRIAKDGGDMTMPTLARTTTDWGKFEPAVRLWEQETSREAPSPTKPDGKDGNHRLSSKFTEWMMGLPQGWITDVGLTRNEELRLAGNGVVPQQAELALRLLLNSDEE
jgi:DNA (cytosine-5)-methyltransferase 1